MLRQTPLRALRRSCVLQKGSDTFFGGSAPSASAPGGLSFGLSETQLQYQQVARKFAEEVMMPASAEHDRTMAFPHEIFKQAWELGLINMHIPVEYGGIGASVVDGLLIHEELTVGCAGMSAAFEDNSVAIAPLLVAGTDAQKKKYLGRMVEEPLVAGYCVTEPDAGSDVASMKTFAKKQGDKWIVNGRKMWITNGGVSNWYFLLSKCEEGFIAFIVDADSPGLIKGEKEIMLGQRCSDTRGITFENVAIPEENVLGTVGKGFHVAMRAFDLTRPPVAIGAVGVARRATDEATKYARERKSMGKFIAEHQAIGFLLADMAAGVEACRLMAWRAGWEADQGRPNTYFASCAKMRAAQHAEFCTTSAIQIFGGNGYNTGYPVEKLYRDGKIFSIFEGTTEIQHLVISRFVTGMRC